MSSACLGSASSANPSGSHRITLLRHRTSRRSPAFSSSPSLPTTFSRIVLASSFATQSRSSSFPQNTKSSPCTRPRRPREGCLKQTALARPLRNPRASRAEAAKRSHCWGASRVPYRHRRSRQQNPGRARSGGSSTHTSLTEGAWRCAFLASRNSSFLLGVPPRRPWPAGWVPVVAPIGAPPRRPWSAGGDPVAASETSSRKASSGGVAAKNASL